MPRVKRKIHWMTVVARVKKAGKEGIAARDLAKLLAVDSEHPDFKHAVELAVKGGKIDGVVGVNELGNVGERLVYVEPPVNRRQARHEKMEKKIAKQEKGGMDWNE